MHGMMMNRPLRIADIITLAEKIHPDEEIISSFGWIFSASVIMSAILNGRFIIIPCIFELPIQFYIFVKLFIWVIIISYF